MEIDIGIAQGKDHIRHISRDLLGDGAFGIARKSAVEIEPVDRRGAPAGKHRRRVDGGKDDEAARDQAWIELADQFAKRDRPFIFIAMIASLQNRGGPLAVADHGDRDAGGAPGILMRRMGDIDEA